MNREPIYAALFALVSNVAGIVSASRRLKHWGDVPPAMQPALYMIQKREMPAESRGLLTVWTLQVDLYLYVHAGRDPNLVPATTLNSLLDAIEAALAPPVGSEAQSLGGLVSHCWIDTSGVQTDEGVLGEQAVAIIPINILVP